MNGPAAHATVVALFQVGGWAGVMLRGPSGSGKSDLALRLIAQGGRLVADDYAVLWTSGGRLYATAPENIAGRIEARGLGIVSQPTRWIAPVGLIVDLSADPMERMPERHSETLRNVRVPCVRLDPRPASAAGHVALTLRSFLSSSSGERSETGGPSGARERDTVADSGPKRLG